MFYLPRKRFRLVWFRMSPRFPSCLAQIHILNAIETEGDEHIIAKNTQHTIIVSDCVVCQQHTERIRMLLVINLRLNYC